jgi:hypothetical protein
MFYKTINLVTGITYAADFLSYLVMVHLLWPSRSYLYFNLLKTGARPPLEELEFTGLMSRDSTSTLSRASSANTE